MIILGLSCLAPGPVVHDVTTALLIDGKIRAAISEDRFTGIKHYNGYPSMGIKYCLQKEGLQLSDVNSVVVGYGLLHDKMDDPKFNCYSYSKPIVDFRTTPMRQKRPKFYDHEYIHAKTGYFFSGFRKAVAI